MTIKKISLKTSLTDVKSSLMQGKFHTNVSESMSQRKQDNLIDTIDVNKPHTDMLDGWEREGIYQLILLLVPL